MVYGFGVSEMGQYKTWTLDSGLDHGLDCGLNNGPDNWTRISIAWGQRLCVINQQHKAYSSVSCRIYASQHTVDYILSLQESSVLSHFYVDTLPILCDSDPQSLIWFEKSTCICMVILNPHSNLVGSSLSTAFCSCPWGLNQYNLGASYGTSGCNPSY